MKIKKILLVFLGIVSLYLVAVYANQKTFYVSVMGNDANRGSKEYPFRTIQHAADLATAGTTIKVLPGVYREAVTLSRSGTPLRPIRFMVDPKQRGQVILAGSEASSQRRWFKCNQEKCAGIPESAMEHVYYAFIDFWETAPYLITEKSNAGADQELHIAREPNFLVTTEWKYHENWWTASDSVASQSTLIDGYHLSPMYNLAGATVYIMDGGQRCGDILYKRLVDVHSNEKGSLKIKGRASLLPIEDGIGPYTKYYVEGRKHLLNVPGEWFYDTEDNDNRLYLWPLADADPTSLAIEVSKNPIGILINDASNIIIDGLTFKYINRREHHDYDIFKLGAIVIAPKPQKTIKNISLRNIKISNSGRGIEVNALDPTTRVENVTLEHSELGNIVKEALLAVAAPKFPSNIQGLNIKNSEFHHAGFNANEPGLNFFRTSKVAIRDSYFHDFALYGINFTSYELSDQKLSDISVANNLLERACQNASACAALKFYGGKYENTEISGNILRDNKGWSYCVEKKYQDDGSGMGLLISNASGIKTVRNLAYDNYGSAFSVYPRQFPATNNQFINNLAAFNNAGIKLQKSHFCRRLQSRGT